MHTSAVRERARPTAPAGLRGLGPGFVWPLPPLARAARAVSPKRGCSCAAHCAPARGRRRRVGSAAPFNPWGCGEVASPARFGIPGVQDPEHDGSKVDLRAVVVDFL